MLGELNDIQIENILTSQVVGRLACTDGKKPYIVPTTFTYDGEFIYGQTNVGEKLRILRMNPEVCLETDIITDMRNWQSVLVFGRFEELKGGDEIKARDILFSRVYPLLTSSTIHHHEHETTGIVDDSNRVKYILYRIRIKKITGRVEKQ